MKSQGACVADIIEIMEQLAPPDLAEEWDNCGLQVGSRKTPVQKIWVALDPLLEVVEAAVENDVDMVITHHPLIFRPLTCIDLESVIGRTIRAAIRGPLTVYAAHTNLDSALEGINDTLAHRIALTSLKPLVSVQKPFARPTHSRQLQEPGLGRVGALPEPMTVHALACHIKTKLGISHVKFVGNPEMEVQLVAVCSGAGTGLMDAFLISDAQVYISGDFKYHDARAVEAAGRAMIDIGHFASEHLFINALVNRLNESMKAPGWSVSVEACLLERDPFRPL